MEWGDERYVRLYTRNTGTWVAIGWEGRFVLMSLLRQVDRAGVLSVTTGEEAETIAAMILAPLEVVKSGLERLIARKVVVAGDDQLRWPTFMSAQEARSSDKVRQQKSREARALGESLSQNVTFGHTSHTAVTNVTPSLAVPSLAVPSREKTVRAKKPRAVVPRETDFLKADFLLVTGKEYKFQGAKDGVAFAELRKTEAMGEIRIRWIRGLRATGWHHVASVAQLLSKWNDLAVDPPATAKQSSFAAADREHDHQPKEGTELF